MNYSNSQRAGVILYLAASLFGGYDKLLKFAVIISKTNGKWIFCKHRERDTYEVPGGHRESGEDILSTAKRELMEETGATDFTIKPILSREKQE